MSKRLSTWKKNYISLSGRITLIKSTFSNLPTYFLLIFKAPGEVIKSIEKMQRDFLWEPGDNRRDHLLSWDMVCRLVDKGGLGLGNLSLRNDVLLGGFPVKLVAYGNRLYLPSMGFMQMVGILILLAGFY